jgi:hypothetical protein
MEMVEMVVVQVVMEMVDGCEDTALLRSGGPSHCINLVENSKPGSAQPKSEVAQKGLS